MPERYDNLKAYYAGQSPHPGFPADYATLQQDGAQYRLMVMTESRDVLIERIGSDGEVVALGQVHSPTALDALLDPLLAKRELESGPSRLELREALAAFEARPKDNVGEHQLVADYHERQRQAREILRAGERASFAVVPVASMLTTAEDDLFRRGHIDYDAADWGRVAAVAVDYLDQGGDPLDQFAVRERAQELGLSADQTAWLESVFTDPICYDSSFVNGRHRVEAARAQGVTHLVVDTQSGLPAARRKAALVRAGAPLLELRALDEPAALTPATSDTGPDFSF